MIVFNNANAESSSSKILRFHSPYTFQNSITQQTVQNLNSFIKESFDSTEVLNLINNSTMLTSVVRMLLVEYIYYDTRGKNEAGKLNAITRQEDIDVPNYIQSFIHSTNLREKIATFVISKTSIRNVDYLETLFLIVLNSILCVIFSNAVQDIKTTMEFEVNPSEYDRLIFKFYRKYYRTGWLNIVKQYIESGSPSDLEKTLHGAFTNTLINIPFENIFDLKHFNVGLGQYAPPQIQQNQMAA